MKDPGSQSWSGENEDVAQRNAEMEELPGPQITYLFTDLYKGTIIGNPKKVL